MSELDPLDPTLAALLREARNEEAPEDARARVLSRLVASVPMLSGQVGPSAVDRPAVAVARAMGGRVFALTTAAFLAGGVVGGAIVATSRPAPEVRVVYVERTSPSSAPLMAPSSAPSGVAVAPSPASVPSASPRGSPIARPRSSAPRAVADALEAERAILDAARACLARGDADAAMERIDAHSATFPHAALAEEREAIAVQALVRAGQYDAARARAAAFRARAPTSLFMPAVDVALSTIP